MNWSSDEEKLLLELRAKGLPVLSITAEFNKLGIPRNYSMIESKLKNIKRNSQYESYTAEANNAPLTGSITFTANEPYIKKQPNGCKRVLAIGDIHAPFEHAHYLNFLLETYSKWNCDTVVCMGDEVDAHSLSKYIPDPDGFSAGHELDRAISHLKPYYKAFPQVDVCTSNHTIRGFKRGFEAGIPKAFFKSYAELLQAPPGWSWHNSIEIDGVLYHHGEGFSGETGHLKAARAAMKSTAIGHIHSHGGVGYIQTEFKRIFGLQTGCGVDISQYAFAYGKNCPSKPTLGAGVILEGKEAYFIPMK